MTDLGAGSDLPVTERFYILKGVRGSSFVGVVVGHLPLIGFISAMLSTPALTLFVVMLIGFVWLWRALWRAGGQQPGRTVPA